MVENNNICKAHSGCITDISNLKGNMHELWVYLKGVEDEVKTINKSIQARINYVLGGVVVACILMVVNLLVGK